MWGGAPALRLRKWGKAVTAENHSQPHSASSSSVSVAFHLFETMKESGYLRSHTFFQGHPFCFWGPKLLPISPSSTKKCAQSRQKRIAPKVANTVGQGRPVGAVHPEPPARSMASLWLRVPARSRPAQFCCGR